jgi:ASC-1-like (ASCH) protein
MPNTHLVILKKCYLDKIIEGSKPVELRLLKTACQPYGSVAIGDKLFLKQSSGPVCATAEISSFQEYNNLTPEKISKLKAVYNHLVFGTDEYWAEKSESKFAVFVWMKNVKPIKPMMIKKLDWRAWVVLKPGNDFGLLRSANIIN